MRKRQSKRQPQLQWDREGWRPFGDRLDFMSAEAAHAVTGGKLKIIKTELRPTT